MMRLIRLGYFASMRGLHILHNNKEVLYEASNLIESTDVQPGCFDCWFLLKITVDRIKIFIALAFY